MILEEETFERFGYYPSKLSCGSDKQIIAACNECGTVRTLRKRAYHALCKSCAQKGKNNPNWHGGSRECKCLWCKKTFYSRRSRIKYGRGKYCCLACRNNSFIHCGKAISERRKKAKRRKLGYIDLNSYFENCEGHHITHTFVLYIPKWLHRYVCHNLNTCQGMKEINALALDFLVNGF